MKEAFADGSYERRLIGWGFAYGRSSAALDVLNLMPNTDDDKLVEILLNEVEQPEVEEHPKFEQACETLLNFSRPTETVTDEGEPFVLGVEIHKS